MYAIRPTSKFRQDLKLCQKRGYNMQAITDVIKKLAAGETLPPQNRDHELSGIYKGFRECHIFHSSVRSLRISMLFSRWFIQLSEYPS